MTFDGVPIGLSDGWQENRRFWRGRCRESGCPGLETELGVVERCWSHFDDDVFATCNGMLTRSPAVTASAP